MTGECIACILRQVLEACELATEDVQARYGAVREAVVCLNTIKLDELDHVTLASDLHRIVREATGNPDPYRELKKMSNRIASEWLSRFKESIEQNASFMDAFQILATLFALGTDLSFIHGLVYGCLHYVVEAMHHGLVYPVHFESCILDVERKFQRDRTEGAARLEFYSHDSRIFLSQILDHPHLSKGHACLRINDRVDNLPYPIFQTSDSHSIHVDSTLLEVGG